MHYDVEHARQIFVCLGWLTETSPYIEVRLRACKQQALVVQDYMYQCNLSLSVLGLIVQNDTLLSLWN